MIPLKKLTGRAQNATPATTTTNTPRIHSSFPNDFISFPFTLKNTHPLPGLFDHHYSNRFELQCAVTIPLCPLYPSHRIGIRGCL